MGNMYDTAALRYDSSLLTRENYSTSKGSTCPLCGKAWKKDEFFGQPKWYVPASEQDFVGSCDPPWADGHGNLAGAFRCPHCEGVYWCHLPWTPADRTRWAKFNAEDAAAHQQGGDDDG